MPLADWNERCGTLRVRAKPAKPGQPAKRKSLRDFLGLNNNEKFMQM